MSDTANHTIDDPFSVEPAEPLWKTLPIFIIFLPVTIVFLALGLLTGLVFIPLFPYISLKWKDWSSSFCNKCLLISIRMPVTTIIDHPKSLDAKLFVSTHTCLFESLVLLYKLGHFRPMAAEFTKRMPIFNKFTHSLNPLYVTRGKDKGKGPSLIEQLKQSLDEGVYKHVIFPEGTYSNGKHVLQFKSGAFVPGHPVTPIAFTFPEYTPFWNREESTFGVQIYRILGRLYTPVTIRFLPTYTPSKDEVENPKLFAENVRLLLSEATGRSLSQYDVKDSPNYRVDVKHSQQKKGKQTKEMTKTTETKKTKNSP